MDDTDHTLVMEGEMKTEAGGRKAGRKKMPVRADVPDAMEPAMVQPGGIAQLIELYKDRLRATQYEHMLLERRLAAADRERIEAATEASTTNARWADEVRAANDALNAVRALLDEDKGLLTALAERTGAGIVSLGEAGEKTLGNVTELREQVAVFDGAMKARLAEVLSRTNESEAGLRGELEALQVALETRSDSLAARAEQNGARISSLGETGEKTLAGMAKVREQLALLEGILEARLSEVLTRTNESGAGLSKEMEVLGARLEEQLFSTVSQADRSGAERHAAILGALDKRRELDESNAAALREEHAGLVQQIDRLTLLARDLEERCRAGQDRQQKLERELACARTNLSALEKVSAEQQQSLQETLRSCDAITQEHERLRHSRSFRLGQALAAARSWRGALALPVNLYAALRHQTPASFVQEPSPGQEYLLQALAEDHAHNGAAAYAAFAGQPLDVGLKAAVLTSFAKQLFARDPDAAIEAGWQAHQLEPVAYRTKWLAFMTFDAGHVTHAATLLAAAGERKNWRASELAKARQIEGAVRLLQALPAIPQRLPAPAWEPIARRTLYVAASGLPYHQTGYTLRTQAICAALRNHGLDVQCVMRPGYPQDRADGSGIEPAGHWEIDGVPYHGGAAKGRRLAPDEGIREAADVLYETMSQLRPAVVHAASNHENALPALIAARRAGIPFVYEVRGLWELTAASRVPGWEGRERDVLERSLEALVATEADCLMTINAPVREELAARGVPTAGALLVPNAVDPSLADAEVGRTEPPAQLADADFVIGYAGSLVTYEGLDDLLRAVAVLRAGHPGARALIVGGGEAEQALKALAAQLGLQDIVAFVGRVSPAQALAYLKLCHCVAIPRKPERVCQVVSPLKPMEAMALGMPVVVSDVRALAEIIDDGRTGLIHRAGDADHLAAVLSRLADDPALVQRLGEAARQHVFAHFTWPVVTAAMLQAYERLVGHTLTQAAALQETGGSVQDLVLPIPPIRNSMTAEERDEFDRVLVHAFGSQGGAGVRLLVDKQSEGKSLKFFAFCAMRAARLLMDEADDANAIELVGLAVSSSEDRSTLKGAATLLFNLGQDEAAAKLVDTLEERGELDDSTRKLATQIHGRQALLELPPTSITTRSSSDGAPTVVNFLHFSLPYTSVGYATRSHGIAQGVLAAGWDIRPYTRLGFPQDFKPELEEAVLPAFDIIDGVRYGRIFGFGRRGMSEVEYMAQAADCCEQILREQNATLVHAASNYTTALPALIAARRLGLPFVYEIRGFWEVTRSSRDKAFEKSRKYRTMKMYEDFVVSNADRIITITSAMKDELVERGIPVDRISLAYNSVDVDRFHALQRDEALAEQLGIPAHVPVIGYVGSFVDYEGLDDLLTAVAELRDSGREFRLLMVGDGAAMQMLQEMVVALELGPWVILTGRVPHEDVESYYSLIDVAPFPRKPWEVCELVSPLKPFEAMAMNKPVVVSGTRALLEIVTDGLNGLVFEKGNPKSLADALDRLLQDSQLRADIGKRARGWVEEYRSWTRVGVDVAAVYSEVLHPADALRKD